MNHRNYIIKISQAAIVVFLLSFLACGNSQKKEKIMEDESVQSEPFFNISLAQWSLHNAINDHGADPFDFAKEAKAMGFEAVEYVNQLYEKQVDSMGLDAVLERIKRESEKHGVENLLIMVDNEPDLADPNVDRRHDHL